MIVIVNAIGFQDQKIRIDYWHQLKANSPFT